VYPKSIGEKSLSAYEKYEFLEKKDRKKGLNLLVHFHENEQSFTEYI
jgi:hypothetical protein